MEYKYLTEEEYLVVQECNEYSGDRLSKILNENGAASMTVCPNCRIDDFTHVEGCKLIR